MDDHLPADDRPDEFLPMRLRMQPGGHAIDLTQPDVLLGRHSEADLRMPMPDVSRRHCRFVYSAAGWQVIDLDSLNGVFVNGMRINSVSILRPGDHVRICGVEFDVETVAGYAADGPDPSAAVLRTLPELMLPASTEEPPQRKAS
jgi:pSer/pThr/pTyr-binding forkhead associated (FHA) protein